MYVSFFNILIMLEVVVVGYGLVIWRKAIKLMIWFTKFELIDVDLRSIIIAEFAACRT